MEVQPGNPDVLAVSLKRPGISPRHGGVAIFENGVARANVTQDHTGSNRIEFSSDPSLLYGYNNETTEFGFRSIAVDADGATESTVAKGLITGFGVDIEFAGGGIYADSGVALDPTVPAVLGTYPGISFSGSGLQVDSGRGRVYITDDSDLHIFDEKTFVSLDVVSFLGISGIAGSLVQWGVNRLAFRTDDDGVLFIDSTAIFCDGFE